VNTVSGASPFTDLLLACGSSVEDLAEDTGVPSYTIRRACSGHGRPNPATAARLADALGVWPADVLDPYGWLVQQRRRSAERQARVERAYRRPATGHESWAEVAPCRHADPELFWPEVSTYPTAALALCDGCPVLGDCRELFLSQDADAGGVWFATTPMDRRLHRLTESREDAA